MVKLINQMTAVKRDDWKQPNWIVPKLWKSAKPLKLAKEFIFTEKEGITYVFEQPRLQDTFLFSLPSNDKMATCTGNDVDLWSISLKYSNLHYF